MPVYFARGGQIGPGGEIELRDRQAWHLFKVLRARPGEVVTVVLDDGLEHQVRLAQLGPDMVRGQVVSSRPSASEPRSAIHLAQAIPKGSGMNEVCERAAELGVAAIWPLLTERTIPRVAPAAGPPRVRHWQAVADEAAQLAGRRVSPTVQIPMALAAALASLRERLPEAQMLACHAAEALVSLARVAWDPLLPTVVLIGPEGGWAPGELSLFAASSVATVSLGPRNLRTILAGLVAVTVLLARADDLEPALPPAGAR